MSHWAKLALPLILGCAAAALNWFTVWSRIAPKDFVRVNKQVDVGEIIAPGDLEKVQIAGDLGTLAETAVPWEERSLLYGWNTRRMLKKGDLVLRQDFSPHSGQKIDPAPGELAVEISISNAIHVPEFLELGASVSFLARRESNGAQAFTETQLESLGPFRILAIGTSTSRLERADESRQSNPYQHILTVAVRESAPGEPDEIGSRLILACNSPRGERIVGVVLAGGAEGPAAASTAQAALEEQPR